MHKEKSLKVIAEMSPKDRWELAKSKLSDTDSAGAVPTLLGHMRAHENTRWLVYSSQIASQIPQSYAAHAFKELQKSALHFEIVRLCTFWDPVDLDSRSIPTIVALADCRGVSQCVYDDHFSHHERFDLEFAEKSGKQARERLRKGVRDSYKIEESTTLSSVRNLRDRLAHQLERTRAEKKTSVPNPLYGDERKLLTKTITNMNRLYLSLSGIDFDWKSARAMHKRNAADFWKGVRIDVLR